MWAGATFALPTASASYAAFTCALNGKPLFPGAGQAQIVGKAQLKPGQSGTLHVHYDTRGLELWQHKFGECVANIRNFRLVVLAHFDRVKFPPQTLSPSDRQPLDDGGSKLVWDFGTLISGFAAGGEGPEWLNAGPVVSRIAYFAPVGLLFVICVVVTIGLMQDKNLHPMRFFFIAAAFFACHLLCSYLADHLSIGLTCLISAAVSVLLVDAHDRRGQLGKKFASPPRPPRPPCRRSPPTGRGCS